MNKHIKRFAGIMGAASVAAAAVALSACSSGATKIYTIEAEFTNLGNKFGAGFSSEVSENQMIEPGAGASNGYCISGMNVPGMTVNFVIESDREVTDAELTLVLGNICNMTFTLSAEDLLVRVDPVSDEDLKSYDDGGAWGKWDQFFLGYYYDSKTPVAKNELSTAPFAGYYLDSFDCGNIVITATENDPSGFKDYVVTSKLHLYKGYTCISIITNNNRTPSGQDNATMTAEAPVVDCIRIKTNATIDMYNPVQNWDYLDTSKAVTVK